VRWRINATWYSYHDRSMITAILIAWVVIGLPTLYFAWRYREFRKFLAGAFFVSAGILFYLYLANVSVPLLGTKIILTPEVSGLRAIPHFIFFLLCLYFGFIKKPKDSGE
jgi:heme/copper-type cytochrome/quinol oxidase subunit 2